MSHSRRALALVFALLLLNVSVVWADDRDELDSEECELLHHMKAPTVYGGTGLFNTYSTRTLDRGEWSVGLFWNNFDRDPGDIDINQVPVNFTLGLADRWEVWVNLIAWQQTTVRQPFLLSGTGYNAVLASRRSPFVFFGPPIGGGDGGAAFFPGTGAFGGGILPALGRFGNPIVPAGVVIIDDFGFPGGAVGLGPAIVTDRPSFYPDLPFIPQVDFLGFDIFGRPSFGVRQSGNGIGDALIGTKVELLAPDLHPHFSVALGGTVTIPTARNDRALARGRTAGEVDFGPFLAFGHEFADGHFRMYENLSYTVTGDPEIGDIVTLDRPDKLGVGFGLSAAPNKHAELIAELNWVRFVGGQTPNLNQNDPLDLTIGARFFFYEGRFSFGGAYRRHLNDADNTTLPVLNNIGFVFLPTFPPPVPIFNAVPVNFPGEDHNGFIAYIGFNSRDECVPPTPPNGPPICTSVTAASPELFIGDSIALMANASDPDGDVLTYTWTATCGRIVGSGSNVTFDATGLTEGTCTVTAQVSDGINPPVSCSITITVKKRPNQCPTVSLVADKTSVTEGETVTFTATATDPDGGPGPITYEWSSSAGSLRRISENQVSLDTTGLAGQTITVTVSTGDGDPNCVRSERVTVVVNAIPKREIDKLVSCTFRRNSARVDNACKQVLDDAALRLQQDPTLQLVVDGHSSTGERAGIALKRAENVRDYLVNEKGIDSRRIVVRSFDDKCPTGDENTDRRVEMYLVPEGRTPDEIQKNCP